MIFWINLINGAIFLWSKIVLPGGLYIRQEVDGGVNFVMNECMLSNLVHIHDQSTVSILKAIAVYL